MRKRTIRDIDALMAQKDKKSYEKQISDLERQLAEAQEEIQRCHKLLWGVQCACCGEIIGKDKQSQDVSLEVLKAHIEICPEHPLSAVKAENTKLRKIFAMVRRYSAEIAEEWFRVDSLTSWRITEVGHKAKRGNECGKKPPDEYINEIRDRRTK